MKSPFPGMDPYLEEYWRDVHHRFLTYACDDLQEYLPDSLRARLQERVFVEPENGDARSIYPDVRVVERPGHTGTALAEAPSAPAEPVVIEVESETATEGFIQIIDIGSGHRVVTVIELLSASNKFPGDGQEKYLQKQREYQRGGVSLVEIDLLREGKRVLAVPGNRIPATHRTTYSVCVTRGWKRNRFEVYAVPLQARLPTIRIPLRETDKDVPLDLQSLIDRCYHNGRYGDIDYRREPSPSLAPDAAKWSAELLSGQGLR